MGKAWSGSSSWIVSDGTGRSTVCANLLIWSVVEGEESDRPKKRHGCHLEGTGSFGIPRVDWVLLVVRFLP